MLRKGALDEFDVARLRVIDATRAADLRRRRRAVVRGRWPSALRFRLALIGELLPVGTEQLDAVVRGRGCARPRSSRRDRREAMRVSMATAGVGSGPNRKTSMPTDGEARDQRGLDHVAGEAGVLADHHAMAVIAAREDAPGRHAHLERNFRRHRESELASPRMPSVPNKVRCHRCFRSIGRSKPFRLSPGILRSSAATAPRRQQPVFDAVQLWSGWQYETKLLTRHEAAGAHGCESCRRHEERHRARRRALPGRSPRRSRPTSLRRKDLRDTETRRGKPEGRLSDAKPAQDRSAKPRAFVPTKRPIPGSRMRRLARDTGLDQRRRCELRRKSAMRPMIVAGSMSIFCAGPRPCTECMTISFAFDAANRDTVRDRESPGCR